MKIKLNTEIRELVEKYVTSGTIMSLYYYIILWCKVNNVSDVIESYYQETYVDSTRNVIDAFAEEEKVKEDPLSFERNPGRCVPPNSTSYQKRNKDVKRKLEVDEKRESEDIDLITNAIILQHLTDTDYQHTQDTEVQNDYLDTGFQGGDASGGGAGGSWSEYN